MASDADMEDYGFEYSDEEQEEQDVEIENQYYRSKGMVETELEDALSGFAEFVKIEPDKAELKIPRDLTEASLSAMVIIGPHWMSSIRSYVSILYLRVPPAFRIILRGRDVEHHNIVNDMMHTEQITYRPKDGPDGLSNFSNMSAVVTIGFVKDAKHHVDVQGFNVYHKNRLIKPFWRIWNAAGSDGRGVIGVLEANFVEPAHDKQGFERTTVLSRLETRLRY